MRYHGQPRRNTGGQGKKQGQKEKRSAPEIPDFDLSNPTPELFSQTALKLAEAFSRDVNKNKKPKDLNQSSQLRKFYDELVDQIEELSNGTDIEVVLPRIKMLQAKAAYAFGRELVGEAFVNFVTRAVEQANDKESIKHFKLLFEAVMGFRKGLEQGLKIRGGE